MEKGSLSQCLGKKRYKSLTKAETQAKEDTIKYGKTMRPYYCGMCDRYHLTSKKRPNEK